MSRNGTKYGIVAALVLVVAAPAIALTQRVAERSPRAGAEMRGEQGPRNNVEERGPRFARGTRAGRAIAAREIGRQRTRGGRAGGLRSSLADRVLRRADELELTDAQRNDVREALRGHREAAINRDAARRIGALELADLMNATTVDLGAVESKLRELSEARIADQVAGLQLERDVTAMLSPEQIEALEDPDEGPRRGPGRPPERRASPRRAR